jgi:hypothetical protein
MVYTSVKAGACATDGEEEEVGIKRSRRSRKRRRIKRKTRMGRR